MKKIVLSIVLIIVMLLTIILAVSLDRVFHGDNQNGIIQDETQAVIGNDDANVEPTPSVDVTVDILHVDEIGSECGDELMNYATPTPIVVPTVPPSQTNPPIILASPQVTNSPLTTPEPTIQPLPEDLPVIEDGTGWG